MEPISPLAPRALAAGRRSVSPNSSRGEADDARLRKACQDFESLLIARLLQAMRATVPKSDFFGSDDSEAVFRDMLDAEIAAAAARRGGTGIAEMLYRQLSAAALKGTKTVVDK